LAGNPGNLTRPGYFFGGWRHSGGGVWQAGYRFVYAAGTAGRVVFYVNWIPTPIRGQVFIPYEIYVSSNLTAAQAEMIMQTVEPLFFNTFGIFLGRQRSRVTPSLNPRLTSIPCVAPHINGRCTTRCGITADGSDCHQRHHRSGWNFLHQRYTNSGNTRVFRFAGSYICWPGGGGGHGHVGGLAYTLGRDMIVSFQPWQGIPLSTTVHEISHIFGATHSIPCRVNQLCVMSTWGVHNIWCEGCRATIMNHRHSLALSANDFDTLYGGGTLTYSPVVNEIAFSSINELVVTYNTMLAGRANNDMAKYAESVNFTALERLYKPTNIPNEYQLYRISVNEDVVTLLYLHKDDLISEYTAWDALIHQRHFQFTFTRWDIENPMAGIMAQTDTTETDLINGRYIFIEPNMFIWASDSEIIYMYTPLNPHRSSFNELDWNNKTVDFVLNSIYDQVQLTETSVLSLSTDDIGR